MGSGQIKNQKPARPCVRLSERLDMNEQKFWAVWRKTGGAAPSKRHDTKEDAITEAGRLAQQSNEQYFVLEVIGVVGPVTLPVNFTAIDA